MEAAKAKYTGMEAYTKKQPWILSAKQEGNNDDKMIWTGLTQSHCPHSTPVGGSDATANIRYRGRAAAPFNC